MTTGLATFRHGIFLVLRLKSFLLTVFNSCRINKESIVDVEGEIKSAAQKVQSCSQEDVEIFVDKVDIT